MHRRHGGKEEEVAFFKDTALELWVVFDQSLIPSNLLIEERRGSAGAAAEDCLDAWL